MPQGRPEAPTSLNELGLLGRLRPQIVGAATEGKRLVESVLEGQAANLDIRQRFALAQVYYSHRPPASGLAGTVAPMM